MQDKYGRPITRDTPLGDLPESLKRERAPGQLFDPGAYMALEWINRYKTTNFGIIIAAAGDSQTILQDNQLRTYLLVQNQDAAADLQLSFSTDAAPGGLGSVVIIAGGNYELIGGQQGGAFCPKQSVNVRSTVAGQQICVVEGTLEPYEIAARG